MKCKCTQVPTCTCASNCWFFSPFSSPLWRLELHLHFRIFNLTLLHCTQNTYFYAIHGCGVCPNYLESWNPNKEQSHWEEIPSSVKGFNCYKGCSFQGSNTTALNKEVWEPARKDKSWGTIGIIHRKQTGPTRTCKFWKKSLDSF